MCDERIFLKPLPSFDKMVTQSDLKFWIIIYIYNVAWKSIWLTDHRKKLYAYWLQFECGLMKVLKLTLLELWGKGVRYESLSISTVW